jgi:hypothetical protein
MHLFHIAGLLGLLETPFRSFIENTNCCRISPERGAKRELIFNIADSARESIMGNAPSTPLQTCLNTICAGRAECVSFPSNPFYQLAWVKPFNTDVDVEPVAVIRPRNAKEVSAAVKCAAAQGVKVQAKSGGHSYA